MKEYIERTEAINAIRQYQYPYGVEFLLANIPAVDVVEVVRCKNCRFFSGRQECYCHAADENGTPIFVREDDFCSYGARMDKEVEHEAG